MRPRKEAEEELERLHQRRDAFTKLKTHKGGCGRAAYDAVGRRIGVVQREIAEHNRMRGAEEDERRKDVLQHQFMRSAKELLDDAMYQAVLEDALNAIRGRSAEKIG